ncbi:uncharacterized protein BDW47DRAFT_123801 [Aspergillus candidus]|uniref:Uncharacterized protein n=1 Tax=Aspergillus candidus TaxID=41067 RepID=A0A2I2FI56_ASPCN|nr:hypothetical protein BDW47DRAFT_123801 [Aspergillus candidus]PLB40303.1 hypothetical protein BDW47DRAFT_123801 [Aspergillus candidus]
MAQTLDIFTLYRQSVPAVLELVRFVYAETGRFAFATGRLRTLITSYMVSALGQLGDDTTFEALLEDGGDFVSDFWRAADSNFYARSLHGYIKNLFTEVYQDEYPVQPGICYVPWGDLPVEELLEIDRYWSVSLTASATGRPRRPHIKCLMSDDIFEGDDRLNRGEIITMIHLIKARLEPPYTTEPVLIFSVMYPHHLRVLEASYNGENLVVGKTPLYDMATYNYALLVSLAKWWLGYPVLGAP